MVLRYPLAAVALSMLVIGLSLGLLVGRGQEEQPQPVITPTDTTTWRVDEAGVTTLLDAPFSCADLEQVAPLAESWRVCGGEFVCQRLVD